MEPRRIILGGIVLFLVAAGLVLYFRSRSINKSLVLAPSLSPSFSPNLESRFNLKTSSTATKINLNPINVEGGGLVSRDFKDDRFTLTIIANLPESESNEFYQVWIQRGQDGDSNYSLISLGKLAMEKGGFLLDYESTKDYSDHKKIVVTKEKVSDGKMETKVLEGSFN